MIIQVYHKTLKQTALICNAGQIHKDIKITGNEQLVGILDEMLNKNVYIPVRDMYYTMRSYIPESCFIFPNGILELHTASDKYMNYFADKYSKDKNHKLFEATIIKEAD